ncbi:hypothetical protein EMIHUDRAFT_202104 [Emiliania huxleyi CCMP1516]|uniref:F5/8 type C domain-containing protein n=2 Tax=Emiliania huxleyi TaxID=2903 RepID=A0A0D3KF10_EMIH1|nr:hypothetical protein EMIHUDRAFT_202104 [Emiliania huxleyi CCMP1516]EOD34345.1 hypothetical protein EMIHUDRAFT_202104 [Emiliania huxleyi CCMP1516]|eukprot:XP_005786774.1 hypothetical protein EMIHUDRAFT_202104 [Emiliania huxleyi CCMP1516]
MMRVLGCLLLPGLALGSHCSRSTVPGYCCSIGCDTAIDLTLYGMSPATCSTGDATLADIFAVASADGCSPLTEGSCAWDSSADAKCISQGLCPAVECNFPPVWNGTTPEVWNGKECTSECPSWCPPEKPPPECTALVGRNRKREGCFSIESGGNCDSYFESFGTIYALCEDTGRGSSVTATVPAGVTKVQYKDALRDNICGSKPVDKCNVLEGSRRRLVDGVETAHGRALQISASFNVIESLNATDTGGLGAPTSHPAGLVMTVTFTSGTDMDSVYIDFSSSTTVICIVTCVPPTDGVALTIEIAVTGAFNESDITSLLTGMTPQVGSGFFGLGFLDGTSKLPDGEAIAVVSRPLLDIDVDSVTTAVVASPAAPAFDALLFVIGAAFDPCVLCNAILRKTGNRPRLYGNPCLPGDPTKTYKDGPKSTADLVQETTECYTNIADDPTNPANYRSQLAAAAGVSAADISLSITAGSLTVTATILTPTMAAAQAAAAGVSSAIGASSGTFMGVSVVSTPAQPTDSSLFDKQAPVSDLSYADSTTGRPWAECGQYTSQWWGVDLGSEVYVRFVRLQNRNDCCAERLTDVDIYLGSTAETYTGNALVKSDVSVSSNVMLEVEINALGRYIYLNRPSAAGLTVCKFYDSSIYDKQAPVSDLSYADSTTGRPWAECGHYTSQWWGVNLGSEVYVRYVRLQNRNDCCPQRLTGIDIYLGTTAETYTGNALVKSDVSVSSNVMLEVEINALGRYIYLNRPSATGLTVCKFYVYGYV